MSIIKRDRTAIWPGEAMWTDDHVDRAFRDMFRDFFSGSAFLDRLTEERTAAMHLEEYMEDGMCVIRAELPGMDPEKDIDISVADGMLSLQAHREERKEEERPDGYRSEFRYGSFARSIRLPAGASESDVKASYRDGVLEVRVPVASEMKSPTRIPVEHA